MLIKSAVPSQIIFFAPILFNSLGSSSTATLLNTLIIGAGEQTLNLCLGRFLPTLLAASAWTARRLGVRGVSARAMMVHVMQSSGWH